MKLKSVYFAEDLAEIFEAIGLDIKTDRVTHIELDANELSVTCNEGNGHERVTFTKLLLGHTSRADGIPFEKPTNDSEGSV